MTQEQCLQLPHHATHLGVCYPGSNFSLTLSNPNNPQSVDWHNVPEPGTLMLAAVAAIVWRIARGK
jgi:hypothetical protein